jgi:O-succinylbenzoate synthase
MCVLKSITIKTIKLYPIAMTLVETLRTSFGEEPFKTAVLLELETDTGVIGWGESSAEINPGYNYETVGTSLHILKEFLVPAMLGKTLTSATEVPALLSEVRGHALAKHALEAAVWDALAKTNEMSLAQAFASHLPKDHQPRGYANVGVSIGIKPTVEDTLEVIEKRLEQGYGRIKHQHNIGIHFSHAARQFHIPTGLNL